MGSNTGNKRSGAIARRTSNSPSGCMPSPDFTLLNHIQSKQISQQGRYDTTKRSFTQVLPPTHVDTSRAQSTTRHTPTAKNPLITQWMKTRVYPTLSTHCRISFSHGDTLHATFFKTSSYLDTCFSKDKRQPRNSYKVAVRTLCA